MLVEKLGGITIYPNDKPKTEKEIMLKQKISILERANTLTKTDPYFHDNDLNTWNNVNRLNSKFYKQYHAKREQGKAIFEKKVDYIIKQDRNKEFQERKIRVLSRKQNMHKSLQNFKLERLTLEKNSNQKILETNISSQILEKINNADCMDEKELILKRSSTHNRIQTRNLWNDREKIIDEKLKFDLTKTVLNGERDAVDMIVSRIEKDNEAEDFQEEIQQLKVENIKQSFKSLKQRNLEESSYISYPYKNGINRSKLLELSKNTRGELEHADKNISFSKNIFSNNSSPNKKNMGNKDYLTGELKNTFLKDLTFNNKLSDYEGYNSVLAKSFKKNNLAKS